MFFMIVKKVSKIGTKLTIHVQQHIKLCYEPKFGCSIYYSYATTEFHISKTWFKCEIKRLYKSQNVDFNTSNGHTYNDNTWIWSHSYVWNYISIYFFCIPTLSYHVYIFWWFSAAKNFGVGVIFFMIVKNVLKIGTQLIIHVQQHIKLCYGPIFGCSICSSYVVIKLYILKIQFKSEKISIRQYDIIFITFLTKLIIR